MAYTRVNWEDLPSQTTPVNATNLNIMDKGIKDLEDSLSAVATSGSYNDLSDKPNIFPIGSIIETYTSTNPDGTYGGTWQRYGTGRVTVDVDTNDSNFNSIGKTGGANSNSYTPAGTIGGTAITENQMPNHNHKGIFWTQVQSGNEVGVDTSGVYGMRLTNYVWGASRVNDSTSKFLTGKTGGGQTHTHSWTGTASNISTLQKYITVYRWRRTA